jgi:diguanylate cyclase (GGDEF)-like protein/PAS domain S-box-containing protein
MAKDGSKPGGQPGRSAGKVSVGTSVSKTPSYTSLPAMTAEAEIRLLLVADGPIVGQVEQALAEGGALARRYERTTFSEALAKLGTGDYDLGLVVCDADGRGLDLVRNWRGHGAPTPLVALGEIALGRSRREQREALKRAGAAESVLLEDLSAALLDLAIDAALNAAELNGQLSDLRERFGLAIRGANDGMWEWNLETDALFFSQRWKELLGFDGDEIGTDTEEWLGRVHPDDLARLRRDLEDLVEGNKSQHTMEHRVQAKDGSYRWVLSRGVVQRDSRGRAVRLAGSLTDISEYREREENLREQSLHDAATDLPRRELFMERLARAVELSRAQSDYSFAVLLVDVDRFGHLHDSVGTRAAEHILAQLARRLEATVSEENLVARFGGQMFAILLENLTDASEATQVADRVNDAVKKPIELDGEQIYVTVSIGVTSSAGNYTNVDDVITDVSTAAGRARDGGTSREIFNTQMRIEAMTMLRLEMQLRQAVERDEFVLHYQPIVTLENRALVGFEALVRWNHPRRGLVAPGEFIPIAENTGLIVPLGRWALHEAARQLGAWRKEFGLSENDLSISVNMSGRQTTDPRLLQEIESALKMNDLGRGSFKLELTESVLMENAELVTDLLNRLRSRGVLIYVDDFGTGYSSLSYLHRFPVDGLKIDKSFVDVLDGTTQSTTMVRTILDLARNLDVEVVAEGIEDDGQAQLLHELGCELAQGYLFARPLSPEDARAEIARFF